MALPPDSAFGSRPCLSVVKSSLTACVFFQGMACAASLRNRDTQSHSHSLSSCKKATATWRAGGESLQNFPSPTGGHYALQTGRQQVARHAARETQTKEHSSGSSSPADLVDRVASFLPFEGSLAPDHLQNLKRSSSHSAN